MTATLLLRLAGPLQAWGDSSRFARRHTRREPTKSGVLGLLAAAEGRRRYDPIEDLVRLRFGVRIDQAGRLLRDFQTAIRWTDSPPKSMPLSYRYYLADAVFVAAVEGQRPVVDGLDEAVRSPTFPLYLGRRSCPPTQPISLGVVDAGLEEALRVADWQAAEWHRRTLQQGEVDLEILVDARLEGNGDEGAFPDVVRDVPRSWSPERREYEWRSVVALEPPARVVNSSGWRPRLSQSSADADIDWFGEAGGIPCT